MTSPPIKENANSRDARLVRLLAIALTLLALGLVLSLAAGKEYVNPISLFTGAYSDDAHRKALSTIVWSLRLPRALGAGLIGMSLALSGLLLQAYFRNPLADPFILGVSSGAALGAAVKIIFLPNIPIPLPVFALAGGFALVSGVWLIARGVRGDETVTLLLSGVALSLLAGSLLSVLVLWGRPGEVGLVMRWLMGSLAGVGYREVAWLAAGAVAGLAISLALSRELNAILLGKTVAQSIGVDVRAVRLWVVGAATALAALAVSAAGIVGFVGLVVPHIARLIVGGGARRLVPVAAAIGASALVWCDLGARAALPSGELPIGAATAIMGVPFFLWLMRRGRYLG
ncbi:MAG: iron ABC transporter permease [bacterium]